MGVSLQKLESKDMIHSPSKRDAGQSMLTFKKQEKQPEKEQIEVPEMAAAEEEEEFFDERDVQAQTKIQKMPIGTQFVIPPISQLDQSVLEALPDTIRDQIIMKKQEEPEKEREVSQSPSSSSVTITPKKQRIIDPFERMRAASITPTKKNINSKSAATTTKKVKINSAPSTPSGSQKRVNTRQSWEPTWSQVDPNVLSELPEEVREEIRRQFQQGSKSTNMVVEDSNPLSRRSISESPRKKQAYLDFLGLRNATNTKEDLNAKAIIDSNAPLPSILPINRSRFGVISSRSSPGPSVQPILKIDPAKVTREELIELEIDPDVFYALPTIVQKETLDQQSNLIEGKKARFKVGRHADDLTYAQQRITQRKIAVPEEEQDSLRAIFKSQTQAQISIKGKSSIEDVCDLITEWIKRFAHSGPRERDVDRFKKFMLECVDGLKTKKVSCDAPIDGLERVYAILACWTRLLRKIDWKEEENHIKQKWWETLNGVRDQVNNSVKRKFGAPFTIKS